jgi:trk system potassium uptake protein TrkA
MNAIDEEALRAQGIDKVDVAIVGIGSTFESAILATVLLKQIGVPRVICRAASGVRAKILEKVGADDIVNPERESAERWRTRLMATNIMERIDLAEDFSLLQVAAPESFVGKSLGDLNVRKKFQVQVVAIRRCTQDTDADGMKRTRNVVISVPMADSVIKAGDVLLLIANDDAMKSFPAR